MSNQLDASIAKRFNITVKQNQTFDPLLTFTDDLNVPISLAGANAKLSVREDGCGCHSCDSETFNLLYKQDFYGTVTGISNNQLQFDDIVMLSAGRYKYDLLITFSNGTQKYFLTGTFKVHKSYTENDS